MHHVFTARQDHVHATPIYNVTPVKFVMHTEVTIIKKIMEENYKNKSQNTLIITPLFTGWPGLQVCCRGYNELKVHFNDAYFFAILCIRATCSHCLYIVVCLLFAMMIPVGAKIMTRESIQLH